MMNCSSAKLYNDFCDQYKGFASDFCNVVTAFPKAVAREYSHITLQTYQALF